MTALRTRVVPAPALTALESQLVPWLRAHDYAVEVPARASAPVAAEHPFETSPAVDYGRAAVRVPAAVARPRTVDELRRLLAQANALGVAVTTRGGGHSAGQQTLTSGLQVDLKGLNDVSLAGDCVRAQGGCRWKRVIRACAPHGVRPAVLIGSQEPTVGGTLSVGGFGDRTPQVGLQIEQVEALTVATMDGGLHRVGPGDPLFDYVLGGRGQLGVIVEALYRTCPLPEVINVQALRLPEPRSYLSLAYAHLLNPVWDAMPAWWNLESNQVEVLAGQTSRASDPLRVAVPRGTGAELVGDVQRAPVLETLEADERVGQAFSSPCFEVVVGLRDAPRMLANLRHALRRMKLDPYLDEGVPLALFRRPSTRPLAPAPKEDEFALIAAVRPVMPAAAAATMLPKMRGLADVMMEAGACLYLMGVEGNHPEFLSRQFGAGTAEAFVRYKREYDPEGRLNPWRPMQAALAAAGVPQLS